MPYLARLKSVQVTDKLNTIADSKEWKELKEHVADIDKT